MAATAELRLLEKSLGLRKGNKYSAQGERQTPVLQTNNGPSLTGLTTIATHLVKQANKEYLLGSTAEEKAVVQQWLEYRITQVDGHSSKEEIHPLLKDLNSYLEDKVYLAGYNFTLADILLYYGLHRFIENEFLKTRGFSTWDSFRRRKILLWWIFIIKHSFPVETTPSQNTLLFYTC
ncbi:eukaryotic translation elongation factor 1 epsilon-1 isoform X1 [Nannospalax galili]|uniref:eukaryotic translation elongation factor 1 epsilon-1 isoform X1 n=1 Tax=Nannospalax galili TaxID=1026970 RepID=UPI00111C5AF6|nr:eukaryotic translation elongation factor 1 epsilon-1 isoform X1 [Nannospalax galili]